MTDTVKKQAARDPGARTAPPAPPAPDRETRLAMYRTMVDCRRFETRAQELFFEGLVRGTTHLGVGQEAVAAGFAAAMREDDYSFATNSSADGKRVITWGPSFVTTTSSSIRAAE